MKYGVLRVLLGKNEPHPFLVKLLIPNKSDSEWEYGKAKSRFDVLMEASRESNSCLCDGWGTPR